MWCYDAFTQFHRSVGKFVCILGLVLRVSSCEFAAVMAVAELTIFVVTVFTESAKLFAPSSFKNSLYADPYLLGVNDYGHVR